MSTVYQHQLHAHKPRRHWHWKRWALVFGVLAIVGAVYGWQSLDSETKITNAAPSVKTVESDTKLQTFRRGTFSIDLPQGWQFTSKQQDIVTAYHFKSTLPGDEGNRSLVVYEDSSLSNLAINRMIPVVATDDGGMVADAGQVSDNCTAYTTGATANRAQVGQLAKWQGIEFLCDMANPLRNVVGTGSKDGLNTVKLADQGGLQHRYFLTYTDNNYKPDYRIFIAAINSFRMMQ
ncbi:MAG TPA: hypothetical protein VGE30_02880 [Candidatus Saccharimonadales bacterium]